MSAPDRPDAPSAGSGDGASGAGSQDRPLVQHFIDRVEADGPRIAFRYKAMGIWHEVTWAEYGAKVERVALGLRSLGVSRGDRVAVLAGAGPEWLWVDLAVQSLGGAVVGLYPTTSVEELGVILARTTPKVLVAGTAGDVDRVSGVWSGVGHLVVINPIGLIGGDDREVVTFAEMEQRGAAAQEADAGAWRRGVAAASADDVVGVYCTAGTTDVPKGVLLSSRSVVRGFTACFEHSVAPGRRDRTVARLPLAYLGERQLCVYAPILYGCVAHLPEDEVTVGEATLEAQPTLLISSPGEWTAAAGQVQIAISQGSRLPRAVYSRAMALRRGVQRARRQGRRPSPLVRVAGWLGYWLVCRQVLDKLGFAQLRLVITTGDALPASVAEQWGLWGVDLHEAYGLVEGGGFVALQARPGAPVVPVAGMEAACAADGELLLRGPSLLAGYAGEDPDIDRDGWFRTGDIAEIADDGGLSIRGRTHDAITLGDRSVMPTEIERQLRMSPFLREAVVFDVGADGLGALLELEARATAGWARQRGVTFTGYGGMVSAPEVRGLVDDEVAAANTSLAAAGLPVVTEHRLLPQPLDAAAGDELTPLRTVRRGPIAAKYAELLGAMGRGARPAAPVGGVR